MEVEEVVTKTVERTDISASSSDAAEIQKKKTTKSREEEPSKLLETPEKESSKSPEKESPKSPEKESPKSPEKESPKSPEKESSKSPEKESSKSPEKESSKSPEKESYKYPKKIPSTSPKKVPTKRATRSMTRQASEVDTEEKDDDYEEEEEEDDSTDSDNLVTVDEIGTVIPKQYTKTKKTTGLVTGIKRKRGQPRANNSTAFEASWNVTDKRRLLIALQRFGILEIDELIKSVPRKTEEEIRKFISLKWRAARTELRKHIREVRRSKGDSSSYLGPVDHWLEILASHYPNYDHYKTNPIAHAILLIWKYEKHPDPSECGGVDFKALYEHLYYTLCGYPPKHLNPPTARYLAESLKNFAGKIKHGEWSDILMHMKTPLQLKTPTRRTVSEDDVIAALSYSREKCLEELANLSGYNPFSIPINLLKRGMQDGK